MRRIIIVVILVGVAALIAAVGYFGFGWGRSWGPSTVTQTGSGFDAKGEATTLPKVLGLARQSIAKIDKEVHDYSAVLVRREFVGGKLPDKPIVMFVKVREKPFSVYLYFMEPDFRKGREVIYVEGRNEGNLQAHEPGMLRRIGTLSLDPKGMVAMNGERYPITNIGVKRLCEQLIERGEGASDAKQVTVLRFPHSSLNKRPCTGLQIIYPVNDPMLWGYLARVLMDDEYQFPTHIEVYELPKDRTKRPQLVEEYTYLDVKINRGLGDGDFDVKNSKYNFP